MDTSMWTYPRDDTEEPMVRTCLRCGASVADEVVHRGPQSPFDDVYATELHERWHKTLQVTLVTALQGPVEGTSVALGEIALEQL